MMKHRTGKRSTLAVLLCILVVFAQTAMVFAADGSGKMDTVLLEGNETAGGNGQGAPSENDVSGDGLQESLGNSGGAEYHYDPQPQSVSDVLAAIEAWAQSGCSLEATPRWENAVPQEMMPAAYICKYVNGDVLFAAPYYTVGIAIAAYDGTVTPNSQISPLRYLTIYADGTYLTTDDEDEYDTNNGYTSALDSGAASVGALESDGTTTILSEEDDLDIFIVSGENTISSLDTAANNLSVDGAGTLNVLSGINANALFMANATMNVTGSGVTATAGLIMVGATLSSINESGDYGILADIVDVMDSSLTAAGSSAGIYANCSVELSMTESADKEIISTATGENGQGIYAGQGIAVTVNGSGNGTLTATATGEGGQGIYCGGATNAVANSSGNATITASGVQCGLYSVYTILLASDGSGNATLLASSTADEGFGAFSGDYVTCYKDASGTVEFTGVAQGSSGTGIHAYCVEVAGGATLSGTGEAYGVYGEMCIVASSAGKIYGEAPYYGVYAAESYIIASCDGTLIKGTATASARKAEGSSAVMIGNDADCDIIAQSGGEIWEHYPNIVVPFNDTIPQNPYVNGVNIGDIANYEWTVNGNPHLTVSGTGLLALYTYNGQRQICGIRTQDESGEVVYIEEGGTHRITFMGTMAAEEPFVDYLTLTYKANGGQGGDIEETYFSEDTVTVSANGFTRGGYSFTGWNTEANGTGTPYAPGDTFTILSDVVLYAQWKANPSDPKPIPPAEQTPNPVNDFVDYILPKTGDPIQLAVLFALLALSASGAALLLLSRRAKRQG